MKTHSSVRPLFFIALSALVLASGFLLAPLAFAAVGASASHNWAGYVAQSGSYTGVRAGWVIPTVPATGELVGDSTWVGIGGVKSADLIQAGTQAITNSKGQISYNAWYELLPENSKLVTTLAVHPGDSVTVSINEQGSGQWVIAINNHTTGENFTKEVAYDSSHSSVEWIEEKPTGVTDSIALDDFGPVTFTNATAIEDGATVTALNAAPLTLVTSARETLATPSALAADGSSFTVTRAD